MYPELTNLLPEERMYVFRRDYFLRLATVAALLLTILVAVHGILLMPAYVYLSQNIKVQSTLLSRVDAKLNSADQAAIEARVKTLSDEVAILGTLGSAVSASSMFREVLAQTTSSITLTALAYKPTTSKGPATISLTGVANSRDNLRAYQLALQSASFAAGVDLPVSAYAKDANISFTMTVTLATKTP